LPPNQTRQPQHPLCVSQRSHRPRHHSTLQTQPPIRPLRPQQTLLRLKPSLPPTRRLHVHQSSLMNLNSQKTGETTHFRSTQIRRTEIQSKPNHQHPTTQSRCGSARRRRRCPRLQTKTTLRRRPQTTHCRPRAQTPKTRAQTTRHRPSLSRRPQIQTSCLRSR